ncbi:protein kinase [uncultured Pontibacter sp.]|uniref:protein kinase domain-containing protein n=1 Tax=uncultured Pontibacter sp. TaxID=453356 RepID=UPI002637DA88|nr:protein kinase [uncultured Pontibacter sp.]
MSTPETNGIFAEHYLLKERLSSGRVEEVWKAEDWSDEGAPVTLRLYAPQIRLDPHSLDLLRKEQEERAALEHPNLLSPSGFGVHAGIPYEVVPLQPQQSLAQKLLLDGPLPEREIALLIRQVATALYFLHTRQPLILHRQLSPDHIMVSNDGAYLLSAPALSSQLRTVLHRATGTPLATGTAYAAPELFGSHPLHSEASDIFGLGVSLYELCTGETPWLGNGGLSLSQGAEIPIVPAPYSRYLSNLVRACLHPDPNKRPSAQVLADEADYYLEHGQWKPYGAFGNVTAESIVYKKGPSIGLILLAVLLVLGAAAATYYFYLREPAKPSKPDTYASTTSSSATSSNSGQIPPDDTTTAIDQTAQAPAKAQKKAVVAQPEQKAVTTAQPEKKPPVQKPVTKPAQRKPAQPLQPTYPRPTSLDGYLNGLLNEEIPLEVRDRWRPAIQKYFSNDAIISAKMNNAPLGSFGVNEFIDILLSSENGNSIILEEIIREEDGTIDEVSVSIITVE